MQNLNSKIEETFLSKAKEEKLTVWIGSSSEECICQGTIEDFDSDVILLQCQNNSVLFYRDNIFSISYPQIYSSNN